MKAICLLCSVVSLFVGIAGPQHPYLSRKLVDDSTMRHLGSQADVEALRREVIRQIWPQGRPLDKPSVPGAGYEVRVQSLTDGLPRRDLLKVSDSSFTQITVEMHSSLGDVEGMAYYIEPHLPGQGPTKNALVIVHSGHAFKFDQQGLDVAVRIFLFEGYPVLAVYMPCMNPDYELADYHRGRNIAVSDGPDCLSRIATEKHPIRYFLDTVDISIQEAVRLHNKNFEHYYMMGLSGGGWTTTIYAAVTPLIDLSFPVAGSIPLYLRDGPNIGSSVVHGELPWNEQYYPPLYSIAGYQDLYVLGASGRTPLNAAREQIQILNANDNCCFAVNGFAHDRREAGVNEKDLRVYEDRVRGALDKVGGTFAVAIDHSSDVGVARRNSPVTSHRCGHYDFPCANAPQAPGHRISCEAIQDFILPEICYADAREPTNHGSAVEK